MTEYRLKRQEGFFKTVIKREPGVAVLKWREGIIGLILFLIWCGGSLPRWHGPIDLRWDASTYYILGKSLAEGKGYRLLNEPGEIRAVQYPPLLPAGIAVVQRILGTDDYYQVGRVLRSIFFLVSGLYLIAIYWVARQVLSQSLSFVTAAVTGLSFSSFIYPSETLYADLPFALASIGFLLCHFWRNRRAAGPLAGLMAIAGYLLRTAGIALLAAWVIESLLCRRWKSAALRAGIAALPIVGWQLYVWSVVHSHEYRFPSFSYQRASYYYPNVSYAENSVLKDPFRPALGIVGNKDLISRMAGNLAALPESLAESSWVAKPLLSGPLSRLPRSWRPTAAIFINGALVLFGLGAFAGCAIFARSKHWILALYFILTCLLVILTPWPSQFWRYLGPIAPLTVIFLITSMASCGRILEARKRMSGTGLSVIGIALLGGVLALQALVVVFYERKLGDVSYYDKSGLEIKQRLLTYEQHWHALDQAFQWIKDNAKPQEIIATSVPQLAYLRSEHKAVLPPFTSDSAQALRLLDGVPVSYLVVDDLRQPPISDLYAAPLVSARAADWEAVFSSADGKTRIYRRVFPKSG